MERIDSAYHQQFDGELMEIDAASDLLGRLPDTKLRAEVAAIREALVEIEEQCSEMLSKLSSLRGRLSSIDPDFDLF